MTPEDFTGLQKIENYIGRALNLSDLRSGIQIIRDARGWRQNEKSIDYIWIVRVSRSFIGFGGLVSVKFNQREFREIKNPEELVQGVFLEGAYGEITQSHFEVESTHFYDPIQKLPKFDLFDANQGVTLDGICYQFRVIANNIDTIISLNNPSSQSWKEWERHLFELGKRLSKKSQNTELIQLFE
ncbi:MAG: hypothetical protein V4714_07000 [Bacteroidota bacterium]